MNGPIRPMPLSTNGNLAAQMGMLCTFASAMAPNSVGQSWRQIRNEFFGRDVRVCGDLPEFPGDRPGQQAILDFRARVLNSTRPLIDSAASSMARSPMTRSWPHRHGFNGLVDITDRVDECLKHGIISNHPAESLIGLSREYARLEKMSAELSIGAVIWSLRNMFETPSMIPESVKVFSFANEISLAILNGDDARELFAKAIEANLDDIYLGDGDEEKRREMRPGPGTLFLAEELGLINAAVKYLLVHFKDDPDGFRALKPGVPLGDLPKAIRKDKSLAYRLNRKC